ncbi:sigma-G-dependent sporulation-specific acid-soluble spore protein CsgA [Bacillus sp. B-jedd]|uniref:sigma-G-dependent sporulation-specific acid-soluble spore protein CsgA n=1 Tax=Bacillus sp. B-jedd TaxID=1476857 RepID=UPI00051560CE|nr:sigma-G-dependent sporulation-specific acid-soluble spore protein CsgA [Bacillus sp. B-jedd]CEG27459.1 sporulation-specific SASP protein [Bacillus sp. B-jedd]
MDQTLAYLREIVSNYTESHGEGKQVYGHLQSFRGSELDFIKKLSQKEIRFLNEILPEEIKYALDEQDEKRAMELNSVYEQLI